MPIAAEWVPPASPPLLSCESKKGGQQLVAKKRTLQEPMRFYKWDTLA